MASIFKGVREYLTPVLSESAFIQRGVLTPQEFVEAGDQLVSQFPTWEWCAGDESRRKAYLPPDKQYLLTRNVPCRRRVAVLESDYGEEELVEGGGGGGADGGGGAGDDDGWLATNTKVDTADGYDEDGGGADDAELGAGAGGAYGAGAGAASLVDAMGGASLDGDGGAAAGGGGGNSKSAPVAIVINTWPWPNATARAWTAMHASQHPKPALDAVTAGCAVCEVEQCDGSVGYGGSPDENGETTLDAMILDGTTMNAGAVADLRRVKNAAAAARLVLEHTSHTLLAGDQATAFALEMGLEASNLTTPQSRAMWEQWRAGNCQPNFRESVAPDPSRSCGPYAPVPESAAANPGGGLSARAARRTSVERGIGRGSHDTISMVAIDAAGTVVAGTSTNGANRKVPGRVGDAPIPGAGAYGDSDVGGCGATGDGDQMMRLLPTFYGVELMRAGKSPQAAADAAIARVARYYPDFWGAVFCVNLAGEHAGAANHGTPFEYTVVSAATGGVPVIITVSNGTSASRTLH